MQVKKSRQKKTLQKKPASYNNRAARVGIRKPTYNDLNEELSNLQKEQKKERGEGLFQAQRAKSAREEENPVVKGRLW